MSENENETKNYKKPLFNHPKENYRIFEKVIIQSEKGGFNIWRLEKDQTPKSLAEYFLSLVRLLKKYFTMTLPLPFFNARKIRII